MKIPKTGAGGVRKPRKPLPKTGNGNKVKPASKPLKKARAEAPPPPPFPKPTVRKNKDGEYVYPYDKRPDHPSFKPIAMPKQLLAQSQYVVNATNDRFYIRTTEPDGTVVGWDLCRGCARHLIRCRCDAFTPAPHIIKWMPEPKSIGDALLEVADAIGDKRQSKVTNPLPKRQTAQGTGAKNPLSRSRPLKPRRDTKGT